MNVSDRVVRFRLELALLAGAFAFAFAAAVPPLTAGADSLASGTQIAAVLQTQDLNTKNAQIGDAFTMNVVRPYPNGDANFGGAVLRGHVASVTSAGQGRKAQLKLAFDSIVFSDGSSQPVSGYVTNMGSKSDNTTARKGLGAGIGALLGGVVAGPLGGVVGGTTGFLYASNDKANLNLAKGAQVTMTTNSAVEVPRRQATQ